MKWEELTAPEFVRAVRKSQGVCIVPLGCIEKHGNHLPLGTDLLDIRAIAEAAVKVEPAVIFPPYYLTQIQCAKHQPGCIALSGRLITELLEAVCDEIARNGFHKILLLNGHGGNEYWLIYAAWMMAHERQRDFTIYVARLCDFWSNTPRYAKMKETKVDDHGGEEETSVMLVVRPDLVRMAEAGQPGKKLGRLDHLPLYSPHWWYADFPGHYSGDGRYGTEKKGKVKFEECVANVASLIGAVKRDRVAPRLRKEFFRKLKHR